MRCFPLGEEIIAWRIRGIYIGRKAALHVDDDWYVYVFLNQSESPFRTENMDDVRFEILYDFQAVRNNYLVFFRCVYASPQSRFYPDRIITHPVDFFLEYRIRMFECYPQADVI